MSKPTAAAKAEPAAPPAAPAAAERSAESVKLAMAQALPPIPALLAQEIWAREAGIKFNTWEAVPKAGTPLANIERPDFWANVSARMKMGDMIVVVPRDGAFYAELVVWDAGQNWARVSVKSALERPAFAAAPGVEEEFDIRRDPIDGVCVFRKSTGAKLKSNFANHEDARRWTLDHQRALRA